MTPGEKAVRAELAILRKRLPCDLPVRLRFIPKDKAGEEGVYGDSDRRKGCYVIRVALMPCKTCMVDTFRHEYAHCRAWGSGQAQSYAHDEHWGLEFARVYREVTEGAA